MSDKQNVKSKFNCDVFRLYKCTVIDEDHMPHRLGDFWAKQPVILIFLRHFACVSCRAHASDVWKNRTVYEKTGAKIVFIGNGASHIIKMFREDLGIADACVFTDPTLQSFHAAGFKRGFIAAWGITSLKNAAKLTIEGNKHGAWTPEKGDIWQLGGILAIKPGGQVTYQYISTSVGDFPVEDEINDTPWISRKD